VLDLASPKLAAVQLAQQGVRRTTVDAVEPEVAVWKRLTNDVANIYPWVSDAASRTSPTRASITVHDQRCRARTAAW
jgi:hypothetical protein